MRLKLLYFLLPLIVNVKTEVEVSYPRAETTARPYFNGANEPRDNQNDWNARPVLKFWPRSEGAQPAQRVYDRLPIRPTPIPLLPPRPAPVQKIADLKPQPAPEPAFTELNYQPDLMLVPKPEISDAVPSNRIRLISRPIPRPFPSSQIPLILETEVKESKAEPSSDLQDPKPAPPLLTNSITANNLPANHFFRTPPGPAKPIPRPIFVSEITTLAPIAQFIIPEPEPTTLEPAQPDPVEHEPEPERPEPEEPDFAILELEQQKPVQLDRTVSLIPENRQKNTYYRRPLSPSRPIARPSLVAQRVEPDSNLQPAAEAASKPETKPEITRQLIPKPIPKPTVVKPLPNPQPIIIQTSPRPSIIITKRPNYPVDNDYLPDYHCEQPNIYYSIESECDSYVECKKYVPRRYICPDGLHFNPRVPFPDYPCGYPSDVKCEGRSIKRDPQPTAQCPRQYGYFPVGDSDCSRYIMCQEGNANVMNCPAGLVFNAEHSSCDWPENVPSCKPNVFQGFTCPEPLLEDDGRVSDIIENYRYGQSCVEYIACQRGHPRLLSCDPGLSFDEGSQTCIDSDYVTGCLVATPRLTQVL